MKFTIVGKKEWQRLIYNLDNSTIFHTWPWIKLLRKHAPKKVNKGARLYPLVLESDAGLAAIPLFVYDVLGFKLVYSPPPKTLTMYLGPVIDAESEKKRVDLICSLLNYISEEFKPSYVRMTAKPGFLDYRPFRWNRYHVGLYSTYFIRLDDDPWKNFPRKLKKNIISAERKYEIRDDKCYLIELIKNLKIRNRLNSSKELIFDVVKTVNHKFIVAEKDGLFLSGTIFLPFKDTVVAWVGNVTPSVKAPSVNELILWKGMEWAIENGYSKFEILGADEYTLFPFKAKFNPIFVPYLNVEMLTKSAKFTKVLKKFLIRGVKFW